MSATIAPARSAAATTRASWQRRPLVGRALRGAATALPLLAGLLVGLVIADVTRTPRTWQEGLARGCAALAASTVVALGVERLARRVLPLGLLYDLSLRFPGDAPQRVRVALRVASAARLRATIAEALEDDQPDVARAAERIAALAAALHAHDRRTRQHSERVRAIAEVLGRAVGLDEDRVAALRWGALLHDVGKLRIPPEILEKPSALSDQEWAVMRRHPTEGARLVTGLGGWLGAGLAPVSQHHERWDGEGYPSGLAGEQIALESRVVAVADAFEVMTSRRAYKHAFDADAARAELVSRAGTQFDPEVVRAMVALDLDDLARMTLPYLWLLELPLVRWFPLHAPAAAGGLTVAAGAVVGGLVPVLAPSAAAADPGLLSRPPVIETIADNGPGWSVASSSGGPDVPWRPGPGRPAWGPAGSVAALRSAEPSEATAVLPSGPIAREPADADDDPPPAPPTLAPAPPPARADAGSGSPGTGDASLSDAPGGGRSTAEPAPPPPAPEPEPAPPPPAPEPEPEPAPPPPAPGPEPAPAPPPDSGGSGGSDEDGDNGSSEYAPGRSVNPPPGQGGTPPGQVDDEVDDDKDKEEKKEK